MREKVIKNSIRYIYGVLSIYIAFVYIGCSDDNKSLNTDESKSYTVAINNFNSYLSNLGLISNVNEINNIDDIIIGTKFWLFNNENNTNTLTFSYIESRIGDKFILSIYYGTYALDTDDGIIYTASCHFKMKESRWFPSNEIIIQVPFNEKINVTIERHQDKIKINNILYNKPK